MNRRILALAALTCSMLAANASAQFVQCTGAPAGVTNCTTQNAAVGTTQFPSRPFAVVQLGPATFQVSERGSAVTCCDGFQFQQVGGNSHMINEENGFMALWTNATQRMTITNVGRVGIGTTTPATPLDVVGNIHSTGSISADGAITAKYADLAEWVASDEALEPAAVVVIAPDSDDHVAPSRGSYATSVAGVVSPNPGIVLGREAKEKWTIATTGRVKVRATTQNGPIRRGDLLVTSDATGTAMRSEPIRINGRTFHQPGTIIGKALEPLEHGTGEILVLLSLQ